MPGQALNDLSLAELLAGTGHTAAGWYGKMAMLGDFASRRLPQAFVDLCDGWLAKGIEASRVQLGDRWLDVYLHGPIWRFAWAPGIVDGGWWFGIMMPSVDKVGRYFPLVITRPTTHAPTGEAGLSALSAWYDHLSAVALRTFQAGATLEDFESALAAAPPFGDQPPMTLSGAPLPGRFRYEAPHPATLSQWLGTMASAESLQAYAGHTLWWPDDANMPDRSFSIAPGLPPAEFFSELLEGRW